MQQKLKPRSYVAFNIKLIYVLNTLNRRYRMAIYRIREKFRGVIDNRESFTMKY